MPPEAEPTYAPPPPPAPTPSPTPPPAAAPVMIPLTSEEYQRLRGIELSLNEIKTQRQKEVDQKAQEAAQALAEKGKIQEAFEEFRKGQEAKLRESEAKYSSLTSRLLSEKKSSIFSQALAGRQFAGKDDEHRSVIARQVLAILDPMFEASLEANDSINVREKLTGRQATDALKELLDSPMFAHFFAPTTKGGPDLSGGSRTPPPTEPQKFLTVEQHAKLWKEQRAGHGGMGLHPVN